MDDFEYERRFFCREMPPQLDDGDAPTLIVQSYYVHADNYALRIRLQTRKARVPMTRDTDPLDVLEQCRDLFSQAFVTIKGPAVGGTRYEAEREIDTRVAVELVRRGGEGALGFKMRVGKVAKDVKIVLECDGREVASRRRQIVTPGEMETLTLTAAQAQILRGAKEAVIRLAEV